MKPLRYKFMQSMEYCVMNGYGAYNEIHDVVSLECSCIEVKGIERAVGSAVKQFGSNIWLHDILVRDTQ